MILRGLMTMSLLYFPKIEPITRLKTWRHYTLTQSIISHPTCLSPFGKNVQVNAFVDASLSVEQTTHRSQILILVYCNKAPIIWSSRWNKKVEAITFDVKFVAMRTMIEMFLGLCYKLSMFGIPIDGTCNIYYDKKAVTKSSINPHVTLKKKHILITFH